MNNETAPLKQFADAIEAAENPRTEFTHYMNQTFKEGDKVYGTWVDRDGRTYGPLHGTIVFYEATGLWVESSNGITEVKRFWTLNHDKTPQP